MHKKVLGKVGEKLHRTLGLFQVTICGVGIILGAGIYALIGVGAGITGNSIWLAFLISSIIAAFTGLGYAELSSIFKKDDSGEYGYVEKAFNKKVAIIIGVLVLLTGVFSSATVAIGFGGYFSKLIPGGFSIILLAIFITLLATWINYTGIKESALFNAIFTAIEAIGLILIIFLGLKHLGSVNYFEMPNGITGLLKATGLVFFAFMGFETIVKLTEETKKPSKNIPWGIIYSLIISTILYILVAICAVSIMNWVKLGASTAPLAEVAAISLGSIAFIAMSIIALFSTSNTVLMTLVTTSRMVYGMAKKKVFPKFLARVNKKQKTPTPAIILTTLATIVIIFIRNIETIAYINNLFLFSTFGFINLCVIVLRYKQPKTKRPFKMPFNIGKFPVLSILGLLSCVTMLYFVLTSLI